MLRIILWVCIWGLRWRVMLLFIDCLFRKFIVNFRNWKWYNEKLYYCKFICVIYIEFVNYIWECNRFDWYYISVYIYMFLFLVIILFSMKMFFFFRLDLIFIIVYFMWGKGKFIGLCYMIRNWGMVKEGRNRWEIEKEK